MTIKRNHMETITPTKSQQKLIERLANILANGKDRTENDIESFLDLLETRQKYFALQDRIRSVNDLMREQPIKRPYVRREKINIAHGKQAVIESSLLEKSGVNAASESLQEQRPESVKRSSRKKETEAEIKGNVSALNDEVIDL